MRPRIGRFILLGLRVFALLGGLSAAACEEPNVSISFVVPAEYRSAVKVSSLAIYLPPSGGDLAPFDCEDIAFGRVDQALLTASKARETSNLGNVDLDRSAPKVLVAEGRAADNTVVVAGCKEVGEVKEDLAVEIEGQPTSSATIAEEGALPVWGSDSALPETVHVQVSDYRGQPLGGAELEWSVVSHNGTAHFGKVNSDSSGKAVFSVLRPEVPGPALLEMRLRWQRGSLPVLKGFAKPETMSRALLDEEVFPECTADPYSCVFGAMTSAQLGRIGPRAEVGIAFFFDPPVKADDLLQCGDAFSACLAACEAVDGACSDNCQYEQQNCASMPENTLLGYRVATSGGPASAGGKIELSWEEYGWMTSLAVIPDKPRDRAVFLTSQNLWLELDTIKNRVIRRPFAPPEGTVMPFQLMGLEACSGTMAEPLALVAFDNGEVGVYSRVGGKALAGHPFGALRLLELASTANEENPAQDDYSGLPATHKGEDVPCFSLLAAGCIAGGDKEFPAVVAVQRNGSYTVHVAVGSSLLSFHKNKFVAGAAFAKELFAAGAAGMRGALLVSQFGVDTPEIARYQFVLREPLTDSLLEVVSADPLLVAAPIVVGGNIERGDASLDAAGLVGFPEPASGMTRYYAQFALGAEHGGRKMSATLPITESTGVPPKIWLADWDGNGLDDLVVLRSSHVGSSDANGGWAKEEPLSPGETEPPVVIDAYLLGWSAN